MLSLLSLLHQKYCIIGGYEFLHSLPLDFDVYKDKGASGQQLPDPVLAMSTESQVRYVLAVAHYKADVLNDLCSQVGSFCAGLETCCETDKME